MPLSAIRLTCSVMPPLLLPAVLPSTKFVTFRYNIPISEICIRSVRVGWDTYPSCPSVSLSRRYYKVRYSLSAHPRRYLYRRYRHLRPRPLIAPLLCPARNRSLLPLCLCRSGMGFAASVVGGRNGRIGHRFLAGGTACPAARDVRGKAVELGLVKARHRRPA